MWKCCGSAFSNFLIRILQVYLVVYHPYSIKFYCRSISIKFYGTTDKGGAWFLKVGVSKRVKHNIFRSFRLWKCFLQKKWGICPPSSYGGAALGLDQRSMHLLIEHRIMVKDMDTPDPHPTVPKDVGSAATYIRKPQIRNHSNSGNLIRKYK